MKSIRLSAAAALLSSVAFPVAANAQAKEITLCWAAGDPANALVELSKDFTAQSGIQMKFEFVPGGNFADRMLNELNSGGKLCDLMIGDSQWIGGGATFGHYAKLNDFCDKEGIKMSDFMQAAVEAYSTWPEGSANYHALPAMGDALGYVYRKDWFARPEIRAAFKEKYGRDLALPTTQKEILEVGQFFQGHEIDGKKLYVIAQYTEHGSEGISMGVSGAVNPFGVKYELTPGKLGIDGAINSPKAIEALEFYKEMYKTTTPPGHSDAYMVETLAPTNQARLPCR